MEGQETHLESRHGEEVGIGNPDVDSLTFISSAKSLDNRGHSSGDASDFEAGEDRSQR